MLEHIWDVNLCVQQLVAVAGAHSLYEFLIRFNSSKPSLRATLDDNIDYVVSITLSYIV